MTSSKQLTSDLEHVCNVVEQFGKRSRRFVLLRASCLFSLTVALGAATLAGLDYLLQLRSMAFVWTLFLSFGAVLIVSVMRIIRPAEQFKPDAVWVAQKLESNFPLLGQRLSTVCDLYSHRYSLSEIQGQFLDCLAREVRHEIRTLELDRCFRPRVILKPVLMVLFVAVSLGGLIGAYPQQAGIAAQRIVLPWTQKHWPRDVELRVLDYRPRVASGGNYEIEIRNLNGQLPSDLMLELQWDGLQTSEFISLEHDSLLASYRLTNVLQSFRFRLNGGDFQDIGWNQVELVPAPVLLDSELTIQPPAYTELESISGAQQSTALSGSTLSLSVVLDGLVSQADLIWDVDGKHQRYPLEIVRQDESFRLELQEMLLESSGAFWVELQDSDGVVSQTKEVWQIDVVEDLAPVVQIDDPDSQVVLTATGTIPLRVKVTDDIRVSTVVWSIDSSELAARHEIFNSESQEFRYLSSPLRPYDANRVLIQHQPDELVLVCHLDVSTLPEVAVGTDFVIQVSAEDQFGNVSEPQSIAYQIVSDRELRAELQQQLSQVQSQFVHVQKLLQNLEATVQQVSRRDLSANSEIRKLLSRMEVQRVNIHEEFEGAGESIRTSLKRIEQTLDLARVEAPLIHESRVRLTQLADQIRGEHLPVIQTEMFLARQSYASSEETWKATLPTLELEISAVIAAIAKVLGQQTQLQSEAEFEVLLKAVLRQQLELQSLTVELFAEGVSRTDSQPFLAVNVLATEQFALSNDVFHLLDRFSVDLEYSLPAEVGVELRGIVTEMRAVALQLRQNQLASASDGQAQIIERVRHVFSVLGLEAQEDKETQDRQRRGVTERLKWLHRQQLALLQAKLEDSRLVAEQQRGLASQAIQFATQTVLPPLVQIGLKDLASIQMALADELEKQEQSTVALEKECVELLEALIGVTAQSTDIGADSEEASVAGTSNAQNLALIAFLQQRLHKSLNPLLSKTTLDSEEQQFFSELLGRQQEIIRAVEFLQQSAEGSSNE